MSSIVRTLRKIKRKYNKFKEDERGGDIINNVLILVVTIIIIALLILFAIEQIDNIGESILDLGDKYTKTITRVTALAQDKGIFNSEYFANEFVYPENFLIRRLYNDFFQIVKSTNYHFF